MKKNHYIYKSSPYIESTPLDIDSDGGIINALQFFTMSEKSRDEYIVADFPEVLFHGRDADFILGNAREAIITIFEDTIYSGCFFDEWIEDESLEDIGIENDFKNLYKHLQVDIDILYGNWRSIQKEAAYILTRLGWSEVIGVIPFISCEDILNIWSYGHYQYQIENATKEVYALNDGQGNINIKGEKSEFILYFREKPYVILWSAYQDSVGYYLLRTGVKAYHKEITQISYKLENGLDPNKNISEQILPVLKLFKDNALHLMNYKPSLYNLNIIDTKSTDLIYFLPLKHTYIFTKPKDNLHNKIIEKYKIFIKSGKLPVILTTSIQGSECSFIIDGHHKFEAYIQLKQDPNIVSIEIPCSKLLKTTGKQTIQKDKRFFILNNRFRYKS